MSTRVKSNFNDIRNSNLSLVLRYIKDQTAMSRADLAKKTGLTRATASSLVDELISMGYIEETGISNSATVGKKATLLDIRTNKIFALGVNFSSNDIISAKIDLTGKCVHRMKKDVADQSADDVIRTLKIMIHEMIAEVNQKDQRYVGIGVSFPGPVHKGKLMFPAAFMELEGCNLRDILTAAYRCPVYVENNADAAALAESWFGRHAQVKVLVYLLIEQGIGCGIVIDNELFYGSNRLANESGHIIVKADGPKCFCGHRGCLVALASDLAVMNLVSDDVVRELAISDRSEPSTKDILKVVNYLEEHPEDFRKDVKVISKYLGIGIADIINVLVPDLILIEGKLVNLPYFLDEVKESVDQHIHPLFRGSFQIQPSQLGVNAPLIGAAAFLLKDVYFNPLKVFTAQLGAVNS